MKPAPGDTRLTGRLLLAANLLPLYGVVVLDWQVFPLILLYWLENLILGAFQMIRIAVAPLAPGVPRWGSLAGKLFLIPFFTVHYGMFCAVHGVFVFALFGGDSPYRFPDPFPTPAAVLQAIRDFHLTLPILALVFSHGFSLVRHVLLAGEQGRQAEAPELMGGLYRRIVALHVSIIFGGWAVMLFGSPLGAMILLVLIKTGIDWKTHQRQHLAAAAALDESGPS